MHNNPIIKYILHNHFLAALCVLALGWFVVSMRYIFVALFISYIIMAALSPMVEFLKRRKLPKSLAVGVSYISALLFITVLIVPLIPFFSAQIQALFTNFPLYLDKSAEAIGFTISTAQVQDFVNSELSSIGKNAIFLTTQVFGGLLSLLTILVVSFYLMLDHARIKSSIGDLFPEYRKEVVATLVLIDEKLGAWVRGQIVLCIFIGVLTWIVLTILGVPFALPLAVIAGLLEIIPTLGPIISAVPAVIVTLAVAPSLTIFVIITYFLIQLLENNLLVPKIMQKAVGLNPVIIIIAVIFGSELMGILGALISVPLMSMLVIIYHSFKKAEA